MIARAFSGRDIHRQRMGSWRIGPKGRRSAGTTRRDSLAVNGPGIDGPGRGLGANQTTGWLGSVAARDAAIEAIAAGLICTAVASRATAASTTGATGSTSQKAEVR